MVLDVGFGGLMVFFLKWWYKLVWWLDIEKIFEKYVGCFKYDIGLIKKIMVDIIVVFS